MTIGQQSRQLSNQGTVLVLASNALEIKFDFEGEIQKIHAAAIAGARFRVSAHWSWPPETIRRLVEDEKPEVIP